MGKIAFILLIFLAGCLETPAPVTMDCPAVPALPPPPAPQKCQEDIEARRQTLEVQNSCFDALEKRESSLKEAREQIISLEDELRSAKEDIQFYRDRATSQ